MGVPPCPILTQSKFVELNHESEPSEIIVFTVKKVAMRYFVLVLFLCLGMVFSSPVTAKSRKPITAAGLASYYHPKAHGRCCTANGERINLRDYTAAHRTLPFGTRVRVSYNQRQVIVRINDRGPYGRRLIDLSTAAFSQLASLKKGVIPVRLEILTAR